MTSKLKVVVTFAYTIAVVCAVLFGAYAVGVSAGTQDCLVRFANTDSDGTAVLRQASKEKDFWDNRVKNLIIKQGYSTTDPKVREAYRQYEIKFNALMTARRENPAPKFKC